MKTTQQDITDAIAASVELTALEARRHCWMAGLWAAVGELRMAKNAMNEATEELMILAGVTLDQAVS